VLWQKITVVKSGSWGYLWQHNDTKVVVRTSDDNPPTPSGYTRIGGFISGLQTKKIYTLAVDNVS
jgi:hypothetical protein